MKKRLKKGFTLMEMLIVVAIIAVLAAIAVPSFNASLDTAKKAADDANIRTAYMESVLNDYDSTITGKPKVEGKLITFGDGTTYELKYYEKVTTGDQQWSGVEKGTK
ncbi:prepilin-type N-terminal cleavage/methylation domain-containing protein [Oscillibacter hominis]|uniref:Prepilin-type N-terminal cleavage/methylation domain-containing protein n=1 Tax=Oscillibacter hominis TaxID=2763056 RepID=A0A7G9B8D5_9FIRM|nr:prepilin-type N-terminal cleavage/methylation domain-containing protein [Oscillibacter hominis]